MLTTLDQLKKKLNYDPETGMFTWIKSGKRAGSLKQSGYRMIHVDYECLYEHKLAWWFYYGVCPSQLDHEDLNKANNIITNLRLATNSQNGANRGVQSNNCTGYKGVSFHYRSGKYLAYIGENGKRKYLGRYNTRQEASEVYSREAERLFGDFNRA